MNKIRFVLPLLFFFNYLQSFLPPQERVQLHPEINITKEESDLLLMSFVIRHGLTDVALEDFIDIINVHLPSRTLHTSRYKFLLNFPDIATVNTHYLCPGCSCDLNINMERIVTCPTCKKVSVVHSLKRSGYSFVHVPLNDQLSRLLSTPLFHQLQRNCQADNELADVTSGAVYKDLRRNGTISEYDISIQFNADGVQTYKSSSVSMCPLQVSINELNYRARKENIFLAGVWATKSKPVLDIFLKPFIDEFKDLHVNGFECQPPGFDEPITVRVHAILSPVDSVERCALQNIHQYNGAFGCLLCLKKGEIIPIGDGRTRVYRGDIDTLRTEDHHRDDALLAETENRVVNGVKGVSVFMLLPIFNIIRSFPPEYMHCILLGVVKLFLTSWLDSSNNSRTWYIGNKQRVINERLLKILPPCEITRVPKSVFEIPQWKASEFRNFLIYYSLPCLKDVLPSLYHKHWSLLVYSIYVFNNDKISN